MHRNRDYWSRPIQNDRLRPDYGNTNLGRPTDNEVGSWWLASIFTIVLFAIAFGLMVPTN